MLIPKLKCLARCTVVQQLVNAAADGAAKHGDKWHSLRQTSEKAIASMPLINIQASVPAVADSNSLLQELSSKLAELLGKPEKYVMTSLQCGVPMTFSGNTEPTCYVEVKSIGALDGSRTQEVSELVCSHIEQNLGIPADRTYIGFEDVPARLWGWNGSTFG